MFRMNAIAIALAAALAACGGKDGNSEKVPDAQKTTGSVALTGDVNKTLPFEAGVISNPASGSWSLIGAGSDGTDSLLALAMKVNSATPVTGNYTFSNMSGSLSYMPSATATTSYTAGNHVTASDSVMGDLSVTLSSVNLLGPISGAGDLSYEVHGTFTAHMPQYGGSGSIAATGSF